MRKISAGFLILALLLVISACNPVEETAQQVVDDVEITLNVEPDPPAVGEAILVITLTNADGTPIDGATIQVHGDMDHEGMIPVDGETVDSEAGVYRVPFAWTMGGGWVLNVTATLPDDRGVAQQQFDMNVSAISNDSVITQHDEDATERDQEAMVADDVEIDYRVIDDPVTIGDSTVMVTVTNANGELIDDAQVMLIGTMNHTGMMPIASEADTGNNGQYRIPIQWTMVGEWQVEIQVILIDGTQATATFEQHVMDATGTEEAHSSDE